MTPLEQRVENRIRDTVCRACIYRTATGGCSFTARQECPILSRVGKIIEIVQTIRSPRMDPYIERLRETICDHCVGQDDKGQCTLRSHCDCALDDYFTMIVELVEVELCAESN